MDDSILDSTELDFEEKDDTVAYVVGGLIHQHVIPILLSPKVIFPLQIMRPIISDPYLKEIFRQAYEEKTVFGYLYHPADAAEKLPKIGQVGVSAQIETLEKTPNDSYLVKIVPMNRFFTDEYIITEPARLTARVKYYYDQFEDEAILKPLREEFTELLVQFGEMLDAEVLKNMRYNNDPVMFDFYVYTLVVNHPFIDEPMKVYLLSIYKLSERLRFIIDALRENLVRVERHMKRQVPFKNN